MKKHDELQKKWDEMMEEYRHNFRPNGWTTREYDRWKFKMIDLQLEILKAMEDL